MAAPEGYSAATLGNFTGHDFGATAPVIVDQDRINGFAGVTGDDQWIHVDVERAKKESPFGGPVAHGFLTLSLLAAAVSEAGCVPPDAKGVVNYGLEKVRFLSPVPSGAPVVCSFTLIAAEEKGAGRTLLRLGAEARVAGGEKPAVICEVLAMVIS